MQPVDIIIPVYGALDSVRECISSVEASELPSTTRVMIYDDATNDVELSSYLRAVATQHPGRFYVRTNHENKGFAATVNAAVNLYTSHDIIILNSDACVPRTWVEKLQQCAYKSMDVGTVTPLTNNGTLASFPVLGREQSLPLGFKYQDVDTALGIANRDVVLEIPTAVGF